MFTCGDGVGGATTPGRFAHSRNGTRNCSDSSIRGGRTACSAFAFYYRRRRAEVGDGADAAHGAFDLVTKTQALLTWQQ
jgi:hypothetical protein